MSKSIIKQKRILTKAAGGSSLATPVSVANGGTGLSSYTVGDLIYASGATTLSKLADVATGNALISGGVGTAPSWGKIGLTTHITGGNWKTIYTNGSGVVTELALGSSGQVLQSNGASSAPTWVTPSSGITVGSTTTTSGTTGSMLMDIGGIVTESASYRAQQASPGGTAFGYNANYGAGTDGYGTVVGNTVYGYEASPSMNVTGRNTFIGYRAGYAYTTGSSGFGGNTFVGWSAGVANSNSLNTTLIGAAISCANYTGSVGIGYGCTVGGDQTVVIGNASASSAASVSIGHEAAATGNYNASIGHQAGKSNTGSYNTFLNTGQFSSTSISGSIGIGYGAIPSSNNTCVIGGNNSNGRITDVYFNGAKHTSAYSVVLNASGGSGSNNAGANLTLAAGKGTGTANAGDYKVQTSVKGASGATLQTLGDRKAIIGKYVDLVDSTPTSFLRINVPTGTVAGGRMLYSIESNDGTDYQCFTEEARWSIINKAGTLTIAISTAPGLTDATAASTGTLTATLTAVDSGSGNADFKLNAISSLTATVLRVNCVVFKNFGTGSITSL